MHWQIMIILSNNHKIKKVINYPYMAQNKINKTNATCIFVYVFDYWEKEVKGVCRNFWHSKHYAQYL